MALLYRGEAGDRWPGDESGVGPVEAELAELATSGATTLVGLMVTDAWGRARQRFTTLFGRGGDSAAVEGRLEAAQADLVRAREAEGIDAGEVAADLAQEWTARLRRLLREDPAAAAELRSLLVELAPPTQSGRDNVQNTFSGVADTVVQGRDFTGGITIN